MFNKTYGYILKHPATKRGYWGEWYYKRRYEKVSKSLSKFCRNEIMAILDFGCGFGMYAQYLEEIGCRCNYVGCDLDKKSLKSAYRGEDTDYVMCDIQRLPFRERSAQVSLVSEVLEHLYSPYATLKDICRITIGTLIITFPEERLLSAFRDRHPEHVSEIGRDAVYNLLASRKFELVQISHIFSSFIPCGILEFLGIPRNRLTQSIVGSLNRLLEKITPSSLVPHKTILIEAKRVTHACAHNHQRAKNYL
jgi:SAM-dependent methyltransferase